LPGFFVGVLGGKAKSELLAILILCCSVSRSVLLLRACRGWLHCVGRLWDFYHGQVLLFVVRNMVVGGWPWWFNSHSLALVVGGWNDISFSRLDGHGWTREGNGDMKR